MTLRARLYWLVGSLVITLLVAIAGSAVFGAQRTRELQVVESRLVPKLELGPKLSAKFERLSQGMQEAVAAQDHAALGATEATREELFALIESPGLLEPADAASLRAAVARYDELARGVSRRMIDDETGEKLVEDIAAMQARQAEVAKLLTQAASLSQSELTSGFDRIEAVSVRADRFRLGIALAGMLIVLVISGRVSRSVLAGVDRLSRGLSRFARGEFEKPIPVVGGDEIDAVAKEANEMAASLRRLAEERDHADSLKAGQVALDEALRGELDESAVAERALSLLAERSKARAGALYVTGHDGRLKLAGRHAVAVSDLEAAEAFRVGEGLVGQAAAGGELVVVDDVPADHFPIRSGLGVSRPAALALVPLLHHDECVGVIELAYLAGCSGVELDLLDATRPAIASALVVARSQETQRLLLKQSQEQAQRLSAQEEELRLNNQELHAQQEELRRANEELESQRRTLSAQNSELEATRVHLQQKAEELGKVSAYKSQFLANMSHELRTPLNSMLLLSHLLSQNDAGNLDTKQVAHCKTIHDAGQDLLSLINQILDLAKIEAGRQELEVSPMDLRAAAMRARAVFEPLAAEKGIQLRVDVEPGVPPVIATDVKRVERILTNLLGNAIKFTERGEVRLRIGLPAREDGTLLLSVSDTGIGIAPEDQQRIFAPFEQLEARTDRKYSGSGLGLSIARESALLLGGELGVESRIGQGSTFTLYLPYQAAAASQRPAPAEEVDDDRASTARGDPHLLVIEDDATLASALVDIVRARGFKAVVAARGEVGFQLARELRPHGIVLDVKLPDVDGWSVMERLRADEATRTIPVHFISSLDERQRGLSLGAIGYLTKPATHDELVGMVRALTPLGTSAVGKVLVVEDDVREGGSLVELLARASIDAQHVTTAADALRALEAAEYGCMILDLGLPDMDGASLLEALGESERVRAPPVIVHTGRALTKSETRQLERYAQAVVLKDGRSAERLLDEVRLFVRHVEERLPYSRRPPAPEPARQEASLDGTTILLAEDDMRTAYALSALLHSKGATVLVAENGRDALEMLAGHPEIRGVLMDVMMPEMDGYEALRRLREDRRFRKVPVIALTARAMKGERERCIAAGASDYLAKPVEPERLLATLETWLAREELDVGAS